MSNASPSEGNESAAHRAVTGLLVLAPSVLLCTIALRQIWLATTGTLSPWKGGGFGMFATYDSPGNRFLEVRGWTSDGEQVRVGVSASAPFGIRSALLQRLRTHPSEPDMQALANALVGARFVESTAGELARREVFFRANPSLFPSLPEHPQRELVLMDRRRQGHHGAMGEQLSAVEIAVWRFGFDAADLSLRTERMLGPLLVEGSSSALSMSSSGGEP